MNLPKGQGKPLGFEPGQGAEGFRVARALETARKRHIKVGAGGVECVPGCSAPARSSPAAPFSPSCICSLRLRARPSRPGLACPRLPGALAYAATVRPGDADLACALGGGLPELTPGREVPAGSPGPSAARGAPARALLSTRRLQTGRRGLPGRRLPVPQCCHPVTLELHPGSLWSELTMQMRSSRQMSR